MFWVFSSIQRQVIKGFKSLHRPVPREIGRSTRWAIFGASPLRDRYPNIFRSTLELRYHSLELHE
jgi:hypothetical protein